MTHSEAPDSWSQLQRGIADLEVGRNDDVAHGAPSPTAPDGSRLKCYARPKGMQEAICA
jgi:hypothetical protein